MRNGKGHTKKYANWRGYTANTFQSSLLLPTSELAGYFHLSLWDKAKKQHTIR
jgi:hypothetical protein